MNATETLQAWLASNPNAQAHWRDLARRLIGYHEAAPMWALFNEFGKVPESVDERSALELEQAKAEASRNVVLAVFADARQAWEHAQDEVKKRPSVKDEAESLKRVRDRIADLRRAIDTASAKGALPRGKAAMATVCGAGLPDATILLGWKDSPEDASAFGYPVALVDLLDVAQQMLDADIKAPRAAQRHTKKPDKTRELLVFVRWLDWLLHQRFGEHLPHAVAHMANAALCLADPIDAARVRDILRDNAGPFAA